MKTKQYKIAQLRNLPEFELGHHIPSYKYLLVITFHHINKLSLLGSELYNIQIFCAVDVIDSMTIITWVLVHHRSLMI